MGRAGKIVNELLLPNLPVSWFSPLFIWTFCPKVWILSKDFVLYFLLRRCRCFDLFFDISCLGRCLHSQTESRKNHSYPRSRVCERIRYVRGSCSENPGQKKRRIIVTVRGTFRQLIRCPSPNPGPFQLNLYFILSNPHEPSASPPQFYLPTGTSLLLSLPPSLVSSLFLVADL